jgi:hypothetical protein
MTVREQRLAQEFRNHAVEFMDASERLHAHKPFLFHPTFYCALHGIELALKSHLAATGYTMSHVAKRSLGHNLSSLLTEALSCGGGLHTQLDVRDQRAIKIGSRSYSRKCFEYPEFLGTTTVPIGQWIGIGRRLIRYADQRINAKAQSR